MELKWAMEGWRREEQELPKVKRGNHQARAREAKMPSVRIYKAQQVRFAAEAQMKYDKAGLFYTNSPDFNTGADIIQQIQTPVNTPEKFLEC